MGLPQTSHRHGEKRAGDSVILNGGVWGKVRTQGVVGKGKALVLRGQSPEARLSLLCREENSVGVLVSQRLPLPGRCYFFFLTMPA